MAVIELPKTLDYPIVAIGDLHGQRDELRRLVETLERLPEWPEVALVFLGDFVDRGPDVRGAIDLVLGLLRRPARRRPGVEILGRALTDLVRPPRDVRGLPGASGDGLGRSASTATADSSPPWPGWSVGRRAASHFWCASMGWPATSRRSTGSS